MSKQQELRNSEIGRIPKEWKVVKLEEIFDIQVGGDIYKLNFSKQKNERYKFPIYSNSLENNGLYGYADTYQYPENCITVTGRGTLGRATPRFEKFNAIIRLLVLIPKANINIMFASEYINTRIGFRIEKTSIPQLTAPKLAKYKIPLPPFPEQQKIAQILSTVDQAIEKVDESIAKTERLKKGLMQELLTKGIGHKEFKDTEIGRIPREWEVVRLKESEGIDLIMGQSPPGKSYNKKRKGLPFIQGKAEFGNKYPSPVLWTTQPTKLSKEGDILISIRAPVGDVNICPFRLCIGRGLAAIRTDKGSNMFYFYWFQKEKQRIENIGKGSTFKAITKDELSNLLLPLPPFPEQQKIAEILSTVDKRLELLREKKEKLERIKKELMNDLLTGKKRVKLEA